MDKLFAISISGLYTVSVFGMNTFFAQADAVNFLGLAERLGLGAIMAILGYKIIIKIIDNFGPPLIARLNDHDADVKVELSLIKNKVSELEMQISSLGV